MIMFYETLPQQDRRAAEKRAKRLLRTTPAAPRPNSRGLCARRWTPPIRSPKTLGAAPPYLKISYPQEGAALEQRCPSYHQPRRVRRQFDDNCLPRRGSPKSRGLRGLVLVLCSWFLSSPSSFFVFRLAIIQRGAKAAHFSLLTCKQSRIVFWASANFVPS
jgi:hypothetical protein